MPYGAIETVVSLFTRSARFLAGTHATDSYFGVTVSGTPEAFHLESLEAWVRQGRPPQKSVLVKLNEAEIQSSRFEFSYEGFEITGPAADQIAEDVVDMNPPWELFTYSRRDPYPRFLPCILSSARDTRMPLLFRAALAPFRSSIRSTTFAKRQMSRAMIHWIRSSRKSPASPVCSLALRQ